MRMPKCLENPRLFYLIIAFIFAILFYINQTNRKGVRTHVGNLVSDVDMAMDKQKIGILNSRISERKHPREQRSPEEFFKQLVSLENQFGGKQIVKYSPQRKYSEFETRRLTNNMEGGDRMSPTHHNYGIHYAKYLSKFTQITHVSALAEIGILKGTGVAIFSDLFPSATIYGFDIDLENIRKNMNFLLEHGAFKNGNLKLQELDQFKPNISTQGDTKFDIVIDDAAHHDKPILSAFEAFYRHLKPIFLYVVEDCDCQSFRNHISQHYKELKIDYIKITTRSIIIFIYPKSFDINL